MAKYGVTVMKTKRRPGEGDEKGGAGRKMEEMARIVSKGELRKAQRPKQSPDIQYRVLDQ